MCSLVPSRVSDLDTKKVVALGRLSEEKDFSSLIDIWALVAPSFPDWKLEIWGDGEERESLERQIACLGLGGSVMLCHQTSEVDPVYRGASIYALTSRHEGYPMVLVEAQTYGLPIVSYSCPIGPRDIVHDGVDGYLIAPGAQIEFAQKLISLMQDSELRHRLGKQALEASEERRPAVIMMQWEELFKQLVSDV